ncbi:Protein takeout [Frankliniella fusca]|uniref:Protein takeout n=1 Tax=Frankliniella fusca TaxID=407009 RepID=A0AAE1LLS6_9NEOP|nr:Protein takeout [Frankliniella fusca]
MLVPVLVLAALGSAQAAALLGDVWKPCPKADPNLNECMMKSVEKFLPILKKGIPRFNIPVLDPLMLGDLDFSTNDLKMVYKDTKMSKLFTDYKVVLVEFDPEKHTMRMNLKVPEVVSEGHYELNGKLMVMPVVGSGAFTLTYQDVNFDLTLHGKPKMKDGKPYMDLVEAKTVFTPTNLLVKVENLFNGNKELSDNFHKFVNENWKDIFNEFKPKIWGSMDVFFKQVFTKIFEDVPLTEIYTY